MEKRQKSTLRQYQVKLAEELILDEDFYAALRQRKLFSDQMIGIIKAEPTDKDKIYRMIKLLPKRGPDAFDKFLEILRENFSWLADMLEDGYSEICQIRDGTDYTDQGKPDPVIMPAPSHNRRSSYDTPAKPKKKAYQTQYSLPFQPASETSTPRYFFTKDFQTDFDDTGSSNSRDNDSKYKDACVSPILTIESPRKAVIAQPKPSQVYERREVGQRMTHIEADSEEDSDDMDGEDVLDGCPGTTPSRVIPVEKDSFEIETSDGTDNVRIEVETENGPASLKAKPSLELMLKDKVVEKKYVEERMKPECRCVSGIIKSTMEDDTQLKGEIYKKLSAFIDNAKDMFDAHGQKTPGRERPVIDNGVEASLEMIDDLADELTDMQISEHVSMVEKCYNLVDTKDRKLPLNMCIENLNEENKDLKQKLKDEEKKSNEMADDMYKHSQEMKKLDKIRARERHLETENQILKEKCTELDKLREDNTTKVNVLQNQVQLLQKRMEQDPDLDEYRREEKKGTKRTTQGARKLSLAGVSRKPGLYPSMGEPRMYSQKSNYAARGSTRSHVSTFRSTKKP